MCSIKIILCYRALFEFYTCTWYSAPLPLPLPFTGNCQCAAESVVACGREQQEDTEGGGQCEGSDGVRPGGPQGKTFHSLAILEP